VLALAKDIQAASNTATGSSSSSTPEIVADYTKNVLEVFKNFVAFCTKSGSLDIICRHWAPHLLPLRHSAEDRWNAYLDQNYRPKQEEVQLPSWILKVKDSSFGPPDDAISGERRAADDLVGDGRKRRYNASRDCKAVVHFGEVDATGENAFRKFDVEPPSVITGT
jgi:hypothetical protein